VAHEGGMVGVEDIANIASESMGHRGFFRMNSMRFIKA
jgi:hypothetical protein